MTGLRSAKNIRLKDSDQNEKGQFLGLVTSRRGVGGSGKSGQKGGLENVTAWASVTVAGLGLRVLA